MSTLPAASKISSTTFNKDLMNVFSVTELYTATVTFLGSTGKGYTGTVTLNPGYNTTNYRVFPSIFAVLPGTGDDRSENLRPVVITARTTTSFSYNIFIAAGYSNSQQTVTLDFLVTYT